MSYKKFSEIIEYIGILKKKSYQNSFPCKTLQNLQNVSNFYFEKGAAKKTYKFLIFFKGRYFVMSGPTDINVDVF